MHDLLHTNQPRSQPGRGPEQQQWPAYHSNQLQPASTTYEPRHPAPCLSLKRTNQVQFIQSLAALNTLYIKNLGTNNATHLPAMNLLNAQITS